MPSYWKKRDTGLRLRGTQEFKHFLHSMQRECLTGSRVFHGVGQAAVDAIRHRTLQGIGVDGQPFPKLEPKYAKKRGTFVRRLSTTGNPKKGMLGAIRYRQGNRKIVIYVRFDYPEHIKAEVHWRGMISGRRHARFKMPPANWWGINDREYYILHRHVSDNVDRFVDRYWQASFSTRF